MNERTMNVNPQVERILWFRYALDEALQCATMPMMNELVEMYLQRNDDELKSLIKLHRPDGQRPKAAREDLLKVLIKKERAEYASGMEVPDLTNRENLQILREFDGDRNAMGRIAMIKLQDPSILAAAKVQTELSTESK